MLIKTIVLGPFQVNCYIIGCSVTREAVIIDPGDEHNLILEAIQDQHLKVKYILLTHGHIDHIGAVAEVRESTDAIIRMHENDASFLANAALQAQFFNLRPPQPFQIDTYVNDGEEIRFGRRELRVLATPGHSPGSVCYHCTDHIFAGDTLFFESVGRTDLPQGSSHQLFDSIAKLLKFPLPAAIYPGHGPATTVEHEKKHNPFLIP